MRSYDSATQARLDDLGGGMVARHLVWVTARDRTTGLPASMGLWNGADERVFTISGSARTYSGAGAMLGIEPITAGVGLDVRMHTLTLAILTPEVAQLLRGYDARLAPIEVHRALFHPASGDLVAEPHRVLKGWINESPISTPGIGGTASVTVSVASAARALTRALSVFRSDAAQRRVDASDRFREYADISGSVGVWWGQRHASGAPPGSNTGVTSPRGNLRFGGGGGGSGSGRFG